MNYAGIIARRDLNWKIANEGKFFDEIYAIIRPDR